MPISETPVLPAQQNGAECRADENWRANAESLQSTQPTLIERIDPHAPGIQWLFARDGSLTAMEPVDRWWAGCSLPRRAAQLMLKKLSIRSMTSCFLAPMHASQVRTALDHLQPQQAIIAIVPQTRVLDVILHCEDLSTAILAHRLWFVSGPRWELDLEKLFFDHPGLATPSEFIRPILADSAPADALIAPAQKVFAAVVAARSETTHSLASGWAPKPGGPRRLCIVAPSRFRLWDDAGAVLGELAVNDEFAKAGVAAECFNSDDPASASPFALAVMLSRCDAIFTPNLGRSDLPGIAHREFPWITWVTSPRTPAADGAGPRDRLLLADPAFRPLAESAGWSASRLDIAAAMQLKLQPASTALLGVLADTHPLALPDQVKEYSSQVLLWESIHQELTGDPFALGTDVDLYLRSRRSRFQIEEAGLDVPTFKNNLIAPAYQQGIARLLVRERVPIRIFGSGWDHIQWAQTHAQGPIGSRAALAGAVEGCSALIHLWPTRYPHPIESIGRPIVCAWGSNRAAFLRDARRVISAPSSAPAPKPHDTLTPARLMRAAFEQ